MENPEPDNRWCPSCEAMVPARAVTMDGYHERQKFDIGASPPLQWKRCPERTLPKQPERVSQR